ncbi:uncharacterized protein B0H64DRAFT_391429 [Chaetomium fimeti]|uniref:Oxidoreductase BOA17 n=1 Tax=Chaetomium fimeti TaxID=1854472 RepID=A0AAE0LTF8_9PEZI|nr:hypothetical protein B0H64DRAFT_391429 [Chaetomium fimeti]
MAPLIWLITGATSGLGEALVSRALAAGDAVVATGRQAEERLAHLKSDKVAVVDLDVSASRERIETQVKKAWECFGRIDILVNNAGFSAPKAIEEASDGFMQRIFDVNVFGPIRVTQAILPYFRSQGCGSVAFIGAGVAWAPIPFLAHYSASKAALDRFAEGLRKELRGQCIHCTIFEPGGFASQLGRPRDRSDDEGFGQYQPTVPDYAGLFAETMGVFANEVAPNIPGDVVKLADIVVDLVRSSEGMAGQLPVRVVLGSDSLALVRQKCKEQLELADGFEHVSRRTDRENAADLRYDGMLGLTSLLS